MPTLPPAYTKRLSRLINAVNAFSDPVPAGMTWVLRTLNVCYGGLLLTEVRVFVGGALLIDRTLFTQPGGPSDTDWNGYMVMLPGEQIHLVSTGQGQGVDLLATGYQFTGVAP